jgi:hypothetical protein
MDYCAFAGLGFEVQMSSREGGTLLDSEQAKTLVSRLILSAVRVWPISS